MLYLNFLLASSRFPKLPVSDPGFRILYMLFVPYQAFTNHNRHRKSRTPFQIISLGENKWKSSKSSSKKWDNELVWLRSVASRKVWYRFAVRDKGRALVKVRNSRYILNGRLLLFKMDFKTKHFSIKVSWDIPNAYFLNDALFGTYELHTHRAYSRATSVKQLSMHGRSTAVMWGNYSLGQNKELWHQSLCRWCNIYLCV